MSFHMSCTGTVGKIREQIEKESAQMTGRNKEEFDAIKPSLLNILDQNVPHQGSQIVLSFAAFGSGTWDNDKKIACSCSVEIKPVPNFIG